MTALPSWIIFAGEAVPVGTGSTTVSVTGNGLWHSTAGVLDAIAYVGTNNQILSTVVSGGNASTSWITVGADISYAGSGNFYVGAISGANGNGGQIPINAVQLSFGAAQVNPTFGQLTTNAATASGLLLAAQSSANASGAGGALTITSGAGTSANGALNLQIASTTQLSINGPGTIITLGPTNLQWQATTSAPVISQVTGTTAGQNLSVLAQNAGGSNQNGGNLILGAGAGTGAGTYGNITLQVGSGAGNAVTLQLGSLNFGASLVPVLSQSTAVASGATFGILAQSAGGSGNAGGGVSIQGGNGTTTGSGGTIGLIAGSSASGTGGNITLTPGTGGNTGGSLIVSLPSPGASGTHSYLQVQEGGTSYALLGRWVAGGNYGGLYLGASGTPATTGNHALLGDGNLNTILNVPTGGQIALSVNAATQHTITSSATNLYSGVAIWNPWSGALTGQNRTITSIAFTGQTTLATAQTLYTYATTANSTVTLYAMSTAKGQGSGCAVATFQNSSGTVTQLGTTTTVWSQGSTSVAISFSVSGTNILVQGASGVASTINWQGQIGANLA